MAAQTKALELGQLSDQLVLCIMGQNIGHTGNINNSGSHRNNSTDEKGDDENLEMKNTAQLTDVWGPSVINQDKAWDLLPSPQSSPNESSLCGKNSSTTGTEIWENAVRQNTKGTLSSSANQSQQPSQPWGHTPTTHIGGTWGEEEDVSNVWTGVPSSNTSSNTGNNNGSVSNDGGNNWGSDGGNNVWNIGSETIKNWGHQSWGDTEPNCGPDNGTALWDQSSKINSANTSRNNTNNNSINASSNSIINNINSVNFLNNETNGNNIGNSCHNSLNSNCNSTSVNSHTLNKSVTNESSSIGTWCPVQVSNCSKKDNVQPSGWEDEDAAKKKNASSGNFDDGTSLWGSPDRQGKVSRWNETQNAKLLNNCANGHNALSQNGTNSSGILPASPGMIRLPLGAPISSKETDCWINKPQSTQLNRAWNESNNNNREPSSSSSSQQPVWGTTSNNANNANTSHNDNLKSNMPQTSSTPGSLSSGWGTDNVSSSLNYWNNKARTNNWLADDQIDTSSWNGNKAKTLTKEMIVSSKQYRILTEMGYKKDDVETALRNNAMKTEEAIADLRAWALRENSADLDMSRKGSALSSSNTPPSLLVNSGLASNSSLSSIMSRSSSLLSQMMQQQPQAQSHLTQSQAQSQPQTQQDQSQTHHQPSQTPIQQSHPQIYPSVNQVHNVLRNQAAPNASSQATLPSEKQLFHLVQQIQLAVQTGHLNAQILNQPLAPHTIQLIYRLLQQIKQLQQLQHQITSQAKPNAPNNNIQSTLHVQITQTKLHISNIQNQINVQQAMFLKQQQQSQTQSSPSQSQSQVAPLVQSSHAQSIQPSLSSGTNNGNSATQLSIQSHPTVDFLNESTSDNIQMASDFRELSLKDFGQSSQNQSRLKTTWKLSGFEREDTSQLLSSEFSRAPGSSKQSSRNDPNSWPNIGTGSSSSAVGGVTGDESSTNWAADSSVGSNGPLSSDIKDGSNIYDLNDLVPEFEPGKPWKGTTQIKLDDPHITPGSVTRSTLSVNTIRDPGILYNNWPTKVSSPSGTSDPLSSLSLSSSTWAYNLASTGPSYNSDVKSSNVNKATNCWGSISRNDVTTPSQAAENLWNGNPTVAKSTRGPPPGLAQVKNQASNANAAGFWSTESLNSQWDRSNGSGFLLLSNLTPQIDGSTLKTLCVQHGPLKLFHLFLRHGRALVRYSTKEEANKAQSALNNCVLGNATIVAQIPSDADAQQWLNMINAGPALSSNPIDWNINGTNSCSVQSDINNKNHDSVGNHFRNPPTSSVLSFAGTSVPPSTTAAASWNPTTPLTNLWSLPNTGSNLWGGGE